MFSVTLERRRTWATACILLLLQCRHAFRERRQSGARRPGALEPAAFSGRCVVLRQSAANSMGIVWNRARAEINSTQGIAQSGIGRLVTCSVRPARTGLVGSPQGSTAAWRRRGRVGTCALSSRRAESSRTRRFAARLEADAWRVRPLPAVAQLAQLDEHRLRIGLRPADRETPRAAWR